MLRVPRKILAFASSVTFHLSSTTDFRNRNKYWLQLQAVNRRNGRNVCCGWGNIC